MRPTLFGVAAFLVSSSSLAAGLTVGVVPSTLKVRPTDQPQLAQSASIMAARNEFEAFQIVLLAGASDVTNVEAKLQTPLAGPGGTIPAANVVLYAERYYSVGTQSNDEGAPGLWPDPLVPDVDPFFGEKRNAFPLTVVANTSRVVWVDVLVPQAQAAGDYGGAIEIDVGGTAAATVPVTLHVGSFALPSTATLASAFGMGWNAPPLVHCGGSFPYCSTLDAANAIRALYVRAALDDRISISVTDFQPPFGADQAPFEKYVLPLIQGTGPTRLPGAKITSVELDGATTDYANWITYAKQSQFFDRLFAYPVDEPNQNAGMWSTFVSDSDALHAVDPTARIILTTSIQDAQQFGADGKIDIMCPVLDEMYGRPTAGQYAGDQRSKYDAWLGANTTQRKLFMYQSCDQHGCGACGDPSPGVDYTGWPERVIDSTGVQDRAFEWWSFLEGTSGELYFETTYQLATAWDVNGQCAFSGSGDGTLFYPGLASVVGGTDDIPIDSIRMKLIREGMEDYEYLVMASKLDATKVRQIALALFPTPYQCNQPVSALESARAQLFAMLDVSNPPPPGGEPFDDAGTNPPGGGGGGCGCHAATASDPRVGLGAVIGLALLGALRRRRARSARV